MSSSFKFMQLRGELERIIRQAREINRKMQGVDIQKVEVANMSAAFNVEQELNKLKGEINQLVLLIENYSRLGISDFAKTFEDKNSAYGYLGAFKGLCRDALNELNYLKKNSDLLLSFHRTFNSKTAKTVNIIGEGSEHLKETMALVGVKDNNGVVQYTNNPNVNYSLGMLPALVMLIALFRQRNK